MASNAYMRANMVTAGRHRTKDWCKNKVMKFKLGVKAVKSHAQTAKKVYKIRINLTVTAVLGNFKGLLWAVLGNTRDLSALTQRQNGFLFLFQL